MRTGHSRHREAECSKVQSLWTKDRRAGLEHPLRSSEIAQVPAFTRSPLKLYGPSLGGVFPKGSSVFLWSNMREVLGYLKKYECWNISRVRALLRKELPCFCLKRSWPQLWLGLVLIVSPMHRICPFLAQFFCFRFRGRDARHEKKRRYGSFLG